MAFIIRDAEVFDADGNYSKKDIFVDGGRCFDLDENTRPSSGVAEFHGYAVLPGLADVHVHLREPGFSYKETIKTGTVAAAAGGYTNVCAMPNLNPVPDSLENLRQELDIIERDAVINVHPYGSITKGELGQELSDMEELAPHVIAFSDDGKGVQSDEIMLKAMTEAKRLGKIIASHCEDERYLKKGGCINEGRITFMINKTGISSQSEWQAVRRDLELVMKTGCKYHVCHVSTRTSIDHIRLAKEAGLDVTCETAPHYLVLNEAYLVTEASRFKMNPPLRQELARQYLVRAVQDGTIDMIATDHAPHALVEKMLPLEQSPMGVPGLETAFPILYTHLVMTPHISLARLVELMSVNPRRRFGITGDPGFTIFDLNAKYVIDGFKFLSKSKISPFDKFEVYGKCLYTAVNGKVAYDKISEN